MALYREQLYSFNYSASIIYTGAGLLLAKQVAAMARRASRLNDCNTL